MLPHAHQGVQTPSAVDISQVTWCACRVGVINFQFQFPAEATHAEAQLLPCNGSSYVNRAQGLAKCTEPGCAWVPLGLAVLQRLIVHQRRLAIIEDRRDM